MTTSTEPLTDAYLLECEQAARRFQGAWTGTSGDLAARLMHALAEIRRLKAEWQLLAVAKLCQKKSALFLTDPGQD